MKKTYEQFVIDNSNWLLRHVKNKLTNKSLAEDIVQEIFIKVFRSYDTYTDEGKERNWLMRIAKTTLCDYFSENGYESLSYEALIEKGEHVFESNVYVSLEEKYELQELINEILVTVAKMSALDRSVFHYRFLLDYSVSDTAEILAVPIGSIKSKTYYIKRKLQNKFGIYERRTAMDCENFELYLFGYAKNLIKRDDIKNHVNSCPKCSAIASSLKKLIPHIPEPVEDKINHVLICVPSDDNELDYLYTAEKITKEKAETANKRTAELKQLIKEGKTSYHKFTRPIISYDNEGNEYGIVMTEGKAEAVKTYYSPIDFYYGEGRNWMFCKPDRDYERPSASNPNLMECRLENNFGPEVFSSLYMAMPRTAKNIKMIRGNGVIDCGEYLFAYVSRHIAEGERIVVEYTYEK